MNLPKLYRIVTIEFWGLRNKVGESLGVIFDCDELVERKARRVRRGDGWKWQILDWRRRAEWDYFIESDQDLLNDHSSEKNGGIEAIK